MEKKPEFKQMVGRAYIYCGDEYKIKSVNHVNADNYRVATDKQDLIVTGEQLITDFRLVQKATSLQRTNQQMMNIELNAMTSLTEILMNNIEKVQDDAKYIEQARSINESAKQIIEVKKAQIEMVKLMKESSFCPPS